MILMHHFAFTERLEVNMTVFARCMEECSVLLSGNHYFMSLFISVLPFLGEVMEF